ncbi:MAG: UPF0182 family protein [Phormidesmis sp.]
MNSPRSSRPSGNSSGNRLDLPELPSLGRWWGLLALVILLIACSSTLTHWLTEYWWFSSAGFAEVFKLRLGWSVLCAVLAFGLYAGVLLANYCLAMWLTRDRPYYIPKNSEWAPLIPGIAFYSAMGVVVLLAVSAAQRGSQAWELLLKFFNPTAFNIADPIYQQDVGFYVFKMPIYEGLQREGLELLVWSMLLALVVYALRGEIRWERGWKYFLTGPVKAHLCLLLSAIALFVALGYWLARYDLLYSASGVVFGAGYTDVNARLHSYVIMGIVTLVLGALFIVSLWRPGFSLPVTSLALYFTVLLVVSGLYPWIQQTLIVKPNELDKETPFIANNLELTRQAYGLNNVQREEFVVKDRLDQAALEKNEGTLSNLRLWDYQTLLSTYQELQSLRLYYRFHDVDIDRYTLDGDYRQVMLAARELDYDAVPDRARNWVNQQLKYTHGYGVAMSPVNQVTVEGLPDFFIKNIPPEVSKAIAPDISITEPRVYYGEETDHYVYTGTSTREFDYPLGNDNATNTYAGTGGVPIGSLLRRLTYAFDFGTLKLLTSNYFTRDSKVHYHRNIVARARQIAPFLQIDSDPYLALVDGRFKWILDGYAMSDRYPYSVPLASSPYAEPFLASTGTLAEIAQSGANYIRDAAKVVIDAYDGSVTLYAISESEPILATYQKIFPGLFTPLADASAELRSHFRYPLNLFQIQSQIYRAYHMADTEVFYNQEDLWQFPQQQGNSGTPEQMQPYYVTMRLPNAESEEFLQILPFTPLNKGNMVAWMAARCDQAHYGELVLYEFPKQLLVYGPGQIEGRIDQNTDISQQLTLWNQQGSSVIRGTLLAIPVDQSLLYFEPVYLQADQGALPELKRVIVAFKDTIVMRQTLPEALAAIFGNSLPDKPAQVGSSSNAGDEPGDLVQAAIAAYEQGEKALQSGDWAAYGQSQRRLGQILQQLNRDPSASAVPSPTKPPQNKPLPTKPTSEPP